MTVTYNAALKTTRMNDVVAAIDGGGGAGYIEIGTAGMGTVLATIILDATCGVVAGSVLTFSSTPLTCASAANSGTAAAARVRNFAAADVITGLTVGLTGTDIVLSSVAIVAGQPVTLTAATITHG
jgi:hypothetical protein